MNIYFISPIGKTTPLLFDTFEEPFLKAGHSIVDKIEDSDIVFLDLYSNLGEYNESDINYITWNNRLSTVIFDATDYGGMSKEIWFNHRQYYHFEYGIAHRLHYMGCNLIYFMRKMDKTKQYPSWVYPYELIQYPDHDFEPTTKDELFNRPYDICFIGNTSPTRESVCNELSKHFKCDFVLGQQRLEHDEWLRRHRQAKFFLSADGGGFSCERSYQLIKVASFMKNKNDHLQQNPFKDATMCIEVNEVPHEIQIANIKMVLNDKNWLYSMYLNGIRHMEKYYSFIYRAEYILSILKQNGYE